MEQAIQALFEYIVSAQAFAELRAAKQAADQNPDARVLLRAYARKQAALSREGLTYEQAQAIMNDLDRDHTRFSQYPLIAAYFARESDFYAFVGGVVEPLYQKITDEILQL